MTARAPADKAAALIALHAGPGFVLPNAWDAGSARILEQVGFPAIATTSAGIAWSLGLPDGGPLDRDTMLEHIGRIVAAVDVPVTADLEAGYGSTPDDVGRTVAQAAALGAVGGNIEDATDGRLLGVDDAVARLAAARAAAPKGTFVLNARTDTYFVGTPGDPFAETVERAVRYVEAGADCIFVPGVVEKGTIRRLAQAIPAPLNVVAGLANVIDAPTLFSLGVVRVSLGGSLARAAFSGLERAGRELLATGTLRFLEGATGYADLQRRFARRATRQVLFIQGAGAGTHDEWDTTLVESLSRELGAAYEVRYPRMPGEDDPTYARWGAAISREIARLADGAVVVGHSVGGTLLIQALAEDPPAGRLGAVVLIAAPFVGAGGWPGDEFELPGDLGARLRRGVPVHLFHGLADETAPPSHAQLYAQAIPQAWLHLLPGRDHQLGDDLSEVADAIRDSTGG